MTDDVLLFFSHAPEALALFELLHEQAMARWPSTVLKVQKTQITFLDPRGYLYASQPRRRGGGLLVSFGLDEPLSSPRIAAMAHPAPRRYTLHVWAADPSALDGELLGWIARSHEYMRLCAARRA